MSPNAFFDSETRDSSASLLEMLHATARASPPLSLIPRTTTSHASSFRLDPTTLAPCSASRSEIERPMPFDPPVTIAVLPLRSNRLPIVTSSFLGQSFVERCERLVFACQTDEERRRL